MENRELEGIHDEIKTNLKKFIGYARKKDVEGMVSLFTENAILVSDQGKAEGRDNIKELYESLMPSFIDGDISSKHVFPIGDKIYEIGTNTMITDVDGKRTEIKGNYVTIWANVDGEWLISEDLLPPVPD